ncbi:MFS transporter, DHA1 family, arabinose polymer transporter [Rhizobium miluonense]|uniref:MFS transporter, DHA1 family, arabinose polymer transporter n=1 Tax=Rhizobium miluonense TaxID=411945 RepID=A0A1C3UUL7_9HYPH|nr:MFS transporter, DHA1 family, arabinose polymer transporter [Rhizobium miluonense]
MSDIAVEALDTQTSLETPSRTAIALVTLALAVGSFGIGTGEFVIMGLLPEVADTFGVTTPEAGHVISAYALGVVVGAPIIAVLAAKMARRTLLLLMMALFAAGNISSAFAPTFESFTVLRFITGLPHGAYFGVAALVAASMVPVHRRVRAVGQVMLGLTIATLIGTPIATYLGQLLEWRAAFMMVGGVGLVTMLLIALFLPKDKVEEGASITRELGALKRIQVWLSLGVAAIGFGGMFSIFSYVATTTTQVAGLGSAMVPVVLALFGIGMNVGNIVGSRLGDISIKGTIGGMMVFNIIIMTLFSLTAANPVMLCICVFLIGCGFAACPAVQTRLMDVAADAQTLAAASNHSAFNIANALGAWLGGLVISWGFTAAATGYVGAVLSVGGLAVFALSVSLERRTGHA